MVYQERAPNIIMVCRIDERMRTHYYWPQRVGEVANHDGLTVKNRDVSR